MQLKWCTKKGDESKPTYTATYLPPPSASTGRPAATAAPTYKPPTKFASATPGVNAIGAVR
jgi:hypothetical protein